MNPFNVFLKERISQIEIEIEDLFRDYENGNISDYTYGQQLLELSIRKDELEKVLTSFATWEAQKQETSCKTCSTCVHWENDENSHDFSWCWKKEHPTFGIEDCEWYQKKSNN